MLMKSPYTLSFRGVTVAIALLGLSSTAAAQTFPKMKVYDTFNDNMLNKEDWIGGIVHATVNEMRRQQARGKLITGLRGFSDRSSDGREKARNSLFIVESKAAGVTALRFKPAVHRAAVSQCVDGRNSNRVKLRAGGYFFNTGAASYCGDRTGDVFAQVWVGRQESTSLPRHLLNVSGGVKVCLDAGCNTEETKYYKNFGTIRKNQLANLAVAWDETNEAFIFRNKTDEFVYDYSGDLVNAGPPSGTYSKGIQSTTDIEDCVAKNGKDAYGIIYGTVNVVRVNEDYMAAAAAASPRCE